MKLEGIHHVTCITGDARRNLDYYTGTLGLRLVKKSINQDSGPGSAAARQRGRFSNQDEATVTYPRVTA